MARRRYQRGSLRLIGTRRKQWQLRYREDLIREGKRVRVLRKIIIGSQTQLPTRKLAQRAAEERLRDINSLSYRAPVEGTFARFAEQWIRDVLSQKKYSTQTTERSRIKNHLLPAFGEFEVREIEPRLIQRFVAGAGLGVKSVRNCIATLRMMWNSAKKWGYTSTDWFDGVSLPEYVKPEAPHFTLEEMRCVISGAEGPFKTFYWLAAETGMRLGELCALRVNSLHLGVGVIVVRYSAWHGRVSSTKARRPRIFRLSPQLIRQLIEQVAPVAGNPEAFVFRTKHGTPWIGDDVVKDNLKPLLKSLGIKQGVAGVGLHAFRHGNATLMDAERTPLKVRQDRLGHVDGEEITLGVYTHAESDDHQAVAAKLGDLLAPVEDDALARMKPASNRHM
jgi:integrase